MRDDVNEAVTLDKAVIATSAAVSTGISIGYVIWVLRGGVLLSSLLASLPAWRMIDPLPVLANLKRDDDAGAEDDSLQNLLKKAKQKAAGESGVDPKLNAVR